MTRTRENRRLATRTGEMGKQFFNADMEDRTMLSKLNAVELELVYGGLAASGSKQPTLRIAGPVANPFGTIADLSQRDDRGETAV